MVKSAATQGTEPTPKRVKRVKKPASGRGRFWLVTFYRLFLLGLGGSVAALVGVSAAQLFPDPTQETPLVTQLVNRSESLFTEVQRLPQTWLGLEEPEPARPVSAAAAFPQMSSPVDRPITEPDRQQLQADLTQLQQDFQQLSDRATQLESRVGNTTPPVPLEDRIQLLQQQLAPDQATTVNPMALTLQPTTTSESEGLLIITLPTDALFDPGQQVLRPGTGAILSALTEELKRYPNALIRVSGYTDEQGSEASNRSRSFEQAKAIQLQLAQKLDQGYDWVVLGYGSQASADNNSPSQHQQNRRIEITIEPR
jgi:outer membrane protein OmpA-like peptidoglycan-associated protein